jgi:hypothetical protein
VPQATQAAAGAAAAVGWGACGAALNGPATSPLRPQYVWTVFCEAAGVQLAWPAFRLAGGVAIERPSPQPPTHTTSHGPATLRRSSSATARRGAAAQNQPETRCCFWWCHRRGGCPAPPAAPGLNGACRLADAPPPFCSAPHGPLACRLDTFLGARRLPGPGALAATACSDRHTRQGEPPAGPLCARARHSAPPAVFDSPRAAPPAAAARPPRCGTINAARGARPPAPRRPSRAAPRTYQSHPHAAARPPRRPPKAQRRSPGAAATAALLRKAEPPPGLALTLHAGGVRACGEARAQLSAPSAAPAERRRLRARARREGVCLRGKGGPHCVAAGRGRAAGVGGRGRHYCRGGHPGEQEGWAWASRCVDPGMYRAQEGAASAQRVPRVRATRRGARGVICRWGRQ